MALKTRPMPFGRLPAPINLDQFILHTGERQDPAPGLPMAPPRFGQLPFTVDPSAQPIPAQAAPQAVPAAPPTATPGAPYKPSAWAILDQVLGGQTITDAKRGLIRQHADDEAMASQRQMLQEAASSIQDPHERLAFLLNPTEYAKQLATRYAAHNVNGGDSLAFGNPGDGGSSWTAPKVEVSGDSAVSITPDKMTVLGQRPMSTSENLELQKLQEAIRAHDLQNKIAQGNLGVANYRAHKAPAAGAAAALPPGYQARPQR